eukprot:scaffold4079_cov167-Amphora_coffeaeformis.AAC.18
MKKSFSPVEDESQPLLLRPPPLPELKSSSFVDNQEERFEGIPPPPPPPPPPRLQHTKISSLDFERVVNEFSIQATRDRFLLDGELQQQQQCEGYGSTTKSRQSTKSSRVFDLMAPKKRKRKPRRTTGRTATRWFLSTAVGLLTGLTTILIAATTGSIVAWRAKILDEWTREDENFPLKRHYMFVLFTIVNLLMATTACVLCVYWAPEGSGSGIPEYVSIQYV